MATPRVKTESQRHRPPTKILVIDVGGTNMKVLATGHATPRRIPSGPTMTARSYGRCGEAVNG